jgi:HD-GYP domain-containing protein (c-di-GMP phosphodiesterase class II)
MNRKTVFAKDSRSLLGTLRVALVPLVVAIAVACGYAVVRFLDGEARDLAIGAGLAVVCGMSVGLLRRRRHAQAPITAASGNDVEPQVRDLKAGYESIIAVLAGALDLTDTVTQGHARRVSSIAAVVAWQMGLRKEHVRQVEKAAILHDIGRFGVADAVLAKNGPLDESELAQMQRHPELGYKILNEIDFLRDAADVVYTHHERYDGQGYPRGISRDDIPIGARLFAVVDAYAAMTSDRPYRKALNHEHAVAEIVRNAGTQFDPEIVRAFLDAEKSGHLDSHVNRRERVMPLEKSRAAAPAAE